MPTSGHIRLLKDAYKCVFKDAYAYFRTHTSAYFRTHETHALKEADDRQRDDIRLHKDAYAYSRTHTTTSARIQVPT